jgi:hypothetical protein
MNVSSIGATQSAYAPAANSSSSTGSDFRSLAQALQSGDLGAAQQAWSSLQQDSPWVARASSASAAGAATSGSPVAAALQLLGSALQSGDVAGAQQAFSSLQQAMQSGHHGGHHHHHATQSVPPAQSAAPSTAPAGGVDTLA